MACWEYANGQKVYVFEKICLPLSWGGTIFIYMTMIFKHHLGNRFASQSQILCGALLGRANENYINVTKMATMAINNKNL